MRSGGRRTLPRTTAGRRRTIPSGTWAEVARAEVARAEFARTEFARRACGGMLFSFASAGAAFAAGAVAWLLTLRGRALAIDLAAQLTHFVEQRIEFGFEFVQTLVCRIVGALAGRFGAVTLGSRRLG